MRAGESSGRLRGVMNKPAPNVFHRVATARRFAALLLAALLSGGCVLVAKSDKAAQAVFDAAGGDPVAVPYDWALKSPEPFNSSTVQPFNSCEAEAAP